ncbi:DNA replication/repair protein RecF [Nitriliruptor alkaliphilus]|uniref:DNA replication/repair protein RecF n=1 Tax=Nitriliruptor alkaliphilus TaxID=427918 RepID=UPI0006988D83|nr:DNA replication/repair protein RecF [Nitriliruptor alkaliphilus]
MHLRRIELVDVRSYDRAALHLDPGVTVLVGRNAQGKTNLLEAVLRAATGGSHRVASDAPLVRAGADLGVIRCEVVTDEGRRRTIELEVGTGRRTRTKVDGQDVRRAADAAGVLRVVLFAPEDVAIVRGDPAERRRFLDDLLSQRRPAFAAARGEYERVLRQRNQLLKQARGLTGSAREGAGATLEVWTEQLVTHGTQLLAARIAAVRALAGPVDAAYRDLADRPEPVGLTYRSSTGVVIDGHAEVDERVPDPGPLADAMRTALAEVAHEEVQRGLTLVGPHRDELELSIGPLPARGYSSHGEAWSLALSLKLATEAVLAEVGDRPVVLLDDVFAELDVVRRGKLADACAAFDQVLVTAAVEEDVPLEGVRVDVTIDGGVSQLSVRGAVA